MNLNEYPDELKNEEQTVLDDLISRMDRVIKNLDRQMRGYVEEARNAKISTNPDLYLSQILAQKGIRDTKENRNKFLQARDELYQCRLLLKYVNYAGHEGIKEIKIGLHSCMNEREKFVISWQRPVCRHYLLDNSSTEYEDVAKGKHGEEYHTNYTLLVKNQVKLRFTRVRDAMNLYPGELDDKTMEMIKGTGFWSDAFLDEMIRRFNPDEYDPDKAAAIISDEFLKELLERRSSPEFKNIVFSIQKKQSEIIQAPYERNMIVQGCAGSGKSMIMLHRLPILLYDHPNNLSRTSLYVITPSQMYIQLAENMRHQLEISDLSMGTIEQYYDYCIGKYAGHKAGEYGKKINYNRKFRREYEEYIYSSQCVEDINNFLDGLCKDTGLSLEQAYSDLNIRRAIRRASGTYAQRISNRISDLQDVLNANNQVVTKYYKAVRNVLDALNTMSGTLRHRKTDVLRAIRRRISRNEEKILTARKELEKLDPEKNAKAVQNRQGIIEAAEKQKNNLQAEMMRVNADDDYFNTLIRLSSRIEQILEPFKGLKAEFSQNTAKSIYQAIGNAGWLVSEFSPVVSEWSGIEEKYTEYVEPSRKELVKVAQSVSALCDITDKYLEFKYYSRIREERETLSKANSGAVKDAYGYVLGKIGIKPNQNGNISAVKYSPYIYLQVLYSFQGAPSSGKESLLAIDEAQSIALEEIRLLKNINGDRVVFNLYGDIYQHIENTKGVESWDEYKDAIDFDIYEMQENYRNASQITEYCNRTFDMKMVAINTPGKGVHVMQNEHEFRSEMITQLMDNQRAGLAAILVSNDAEARYLMAEFSQYEQKFHDMTDEDFSIHRTRWNIITIDDAKGLEFSSVIVLSGRMSRNQSYIAFTRALDDLYIYQEEIDISEYLKKPSKNQDSSQDEPGSGTTGTGEPKHKKKERVKHTDSALRQFFEGKGLEVIDRRDDGGRLWVIGEKDAIRETINAAVEKFNISGKYASGNEISNKKGWYTKSDK